MSAVKSSATRVATGGVRNAQGDPAWVRWTLTLAALALLAWLIVIPVVNVFWEALRNGPAAYWKALVGDADTLAAIRLTLTVAPIAVALNADLCEIYTDMP